MSLYNWITLAIIAIGWAVTYGKLCQKLKELESDTIKLEHEMKSIQKWGEDEIKKQVRYREDHYVSKDIFLQCNNEINRRLEQFDSLELAANLAEIKAMLVALKEQIKNGGR